MNSKLQTETTSGLRLRWGNGTVKHNAIIFSSALCRLDTFSSISFISKMKRLAGRRSAGRQMRSGSVWRKNRESMMLERQTNENEVGGRKRKRSTNRGEWFRVCPIYIIKTVYTLPFKSWGQKYIYTLNQLGHIDLIKSDSKDLFNVTKGLFFK